MVSPAVMEVWAVKAALLPTKVIWDCGWMVTFTVADTFSAPSTAKHRTMAMARLQWATFLVIMGFNFLIFRIKNVEIRIRTLLKAKPGKYRLRHTGFHPGH